jgi:hypothetical protein
MTNLKGKLKILLQTGILMNLLSKGMKLGKAASDVKIDIKLSTIKHIHASWIVAAKLCLRGV